MAASKAVRTVLVMNDKKQKDLIGHVATSTQSVSSKFRRDYWSDSDLLAVAALCGYKLAFIKGEEVIEIK